MRTDGGVEGTYMGYAPERTYNQLLYYTGGLSKDKEHVVVCLAPFLQLAFHSFSYSGCCVSGLASLLHWASREKG